MHASNAFFRALTILIDRSKKNYHFSSKIQGVKVFRKNKKNALTRVARHLFWANHKCTFCFGKSQRHKSYKSTKIHSFFVLTPQKDFPYHLFLFPPGNHHRISSCFNFETQISWEKLRYFATFFLEFMYLLAFYLAFYKWH